MQAASSAQGRHFNFSWAGKLFLFFNATGLLKNWKKQHLICSNLTLFIVPFFLSFIFFFFLFFLFFFSFFLFFFFLFPWGGRRPFQPPQMTPLRRPLLPSVEFRPASLCLYKESEERGWLNEVIGEQFSNEFRHLK